MYYFLLPARFLSEVINVLVMFAVSIFFCTITYKTLVRYPWVGSLIPWMDTGGLNSYPYEAKTNKYPNKELFPPDPHYVITIITFVPVITEKYFSPYQVYAKHLF